MITLQSLACPATKHRTPEGPRDRHDCAALYVANGASDALGEARPGHRGREHTHCNTAAWTLVQIRHTCVLLVHLWARRIGMEYAGSAWDEPHDYGVHPTRVLNALLMYGMDEMTTQREEGMAKLREFIQAVNISTPVHGEEDRPW
jgi:hypothetical protein